MTEFWQSSKNDWCHFCKCFVNPHANSRRMHEQSNNHKRNVELKMREIRKNSKQGAKEEEMAKQMLAGIEARAAEAYRADLAAGARPEDTHGPQLMSAEARLRKDQEAARRELEDAVEKELKVRAEAEYRSQQAKGEWKFDDRSSYYWHAKSTCYYDPKSGMYFSTKNNAWSKQAPQVSLDERRRDKPRPRTVHTKLCFLMPATSNCQLLQDTPAPPDTGTNGAAPKDCLSAAQLDENQYALGPFARAANPTQPEPPSAVGTSATASTIGHTTKAVVAAGQVKNNAAGWTHAPTGNTPDGENGSASKARGMTSLFNLGYGTNHPKYEAAKARTQGAAQRTMEAAGGRSFQAEGAKKLGLVTKGNKVGKRKRQEETAEPEVKVSNEEAEALAKRAAARARVEARTMKTFGLN